MKKIIRIVALFLFILLMNNICFATGGDLSLFTGTYALINDLTSKLTIIFPAIAILLIIIFNISKSGADQNEQTVWTKRIRIVIISLIVGETAAGIITYITSFYN